MAYSELKLSPVPEKVREILIAELMLLSYEGFQEIEDTLIAYIPTEAYNAEHISELLEKYHLGQTKSSLKELEDINWNKEWESNYDPVIIGDKVLIKASFHQIDNIERFSHVIHLDPKMSFGTGHHETTTMMIRHMMELEFKDIKVFDFGTGTGVLAIMAHLLGAKEIKAIDHEHWAVENAEENFQKNGCTDISLEKAGAESLGSDIYDIILANVNRSVIVNNLSAFSESLAIGGKILFSGILTEDLEMLEEKCSLYDLAVYKSMKMNKWALLSVEKAL